ncbi:MAG: NAD-dependent epimerase/dehydratase family protein [Bacteroidia bacterium]
MNNKILILGGGGFLGKALCETLRNNSFQVTCADLTDPVQKGITYRKMDLLAADEVADAVMGFDTVINCSGQITKPINTCFRLNSEGINNIVKALNKSGGTLIHFSTSTVYGSCESADEETPVNPETPYSACKAFAEYAIRSQLPVSQYCIIRLSNLYGEQQQKGIFSYLNRSRLSDRKLEFNNNGELLRYFLHVKDCAEWVRAIVQAPKEEIQGIYNLPGHEKFTVRQLVGLYEEVTKCTFSVTYTNDTPWENTLLLSDRRIRKIINMNPANSIRSTIQAMIN